MEKFKRAPKKKTPLKPTRVEIEEGVVHVELSPQLKERLCEAAIMRANLKRILFAKR
jgi:hypothetical protein